MTTLHKVAMAEIRKRQISGDYKDEPIRNRLIIVDRKDGQIRKRQISGDHKDEPIRKRQISDDHKDEQIRKRQISSDHKNEQIRTTKFTCPGNYEDEVTMLFEDGKELYVSKNFLRHVSEAFHLMFDKNSKFLENKSGIIKMVDKSYDNVLELLCHLDPFMQKEVARTNVFEIVPLAEEYMIPGSIRKCRNCLMTLLMNKLDFLRVNEDQTEIVDALLTAFKYDYKDIQEQAIKVISKWRQFGSNWPESYDRIPEDFKLKILEKRLSDKGDKLVPAGKD